MILHNQRSGIPYTKEQVRRWLTFLASNMQQREQTIFLIEQLQPTWLVTRWQRWLYIFMSRLLWMGLSGGLVMGVGSLFIQPKDLFVWLFIQMFILLITGLSVGLLDILRTRLRYKRFLEWTLRYPRTFVVDLLVIGVSSSLFSLLFITFSEDIFFWLFRDLSRRDLGAAWQSGTVIYILSGWCVWNRRSTQRHPDNEIHTIETVTWSWHNFRQNGQQGLFFGVLTVFSGMLLFGLFVLPIAGLIRALNGQLSEELVRLSYSSAIGIGILGGLIFGIFYGLLGGIVLYRNGSQTLSGDEIQIFKTIKWSYKNARRNGLQGLIFGLTFGVLNGSFIELLDGNVTLAKQQGELIIGAFDGLLFGLL